MAKTNEKPISDAELARMEKNLDAFEKRVIAAEEEERRQKQDAAVEDEDGQEEEGGEEEEEQEEEEEEEEGESEWHRVRREAQERRDAEEKRAEKARTKRQKETRERFLSSVDWWHEDVKAAPPAHMLRALRIVLQRRILWDAGDAVHFEADKWGNFFVDREAIDSLQKPMALVLQIARAEHKMQCDERRLARKLAPPRKRTARKSSNSLKKRGKIR